LAEDVNLLVLFYVPHEDSIVAQKDRVPAVRRQVAVLPRQAGVLDATDKRQPGVGFADARHAAFFRQSQDHDAAIGRAGGDVAPVGAEGHSNRRPRRPETKRPLSNRLGGQIPQPEGSVLASPSYHAAVGSNGQLVEAVGAAAQPPDALAGLRVPEG